MAVNNIGQCPKFRFLFHTSNIQLYPITLKEIIVLYPKACSVPKLHPRLVFIRDIICIFVKLHIELFCTDGGHYIETMLTHCKILG